MPNMNDFNLNVQTENTATPDDFSDVLQAVITATGDPVVTESTDPTPKPNEVTIPVPSKTELTPEQYNEAIKALQKSFVEGAEILGMLQQVTITEAPGMTLEELQEAYTEAAINDAIFESYAEGPYFEAASNARKADIKAAVKAIMAAGTTSRADKYGLKMFKMGATKRSDLENYQVANEISTSARQAVSSAQTAAFMAGGTIASATGAALVAAPVAALIAAGIMVGATAIKKKTLDRFLLNRLRDDKTIKTRYWQMVGSFLAKEDELDDAIAHYTKLFENELQQGGFDLKFGAIKLRVTGRTKEKNYEGFCYLLTVDSDSDTSEIIDIPLDEKELGFGKKDKSEKKDGDPETDPKKDDKKVEEPKIPAGAKK